MRQERYDKVKYIAVTVPKKKVYTETDFDKDWRIMDEAIDFIFRKTKIRNDMKMQKLRSIASNMVMERFGDKLYSRLQNAITVHSKEVSNHIKCIEGYSLLEELNMKWKSYDSAISIIEGMVSFMDASFVLQTHKTSVKELSLNLWRDNVIHSDNTKTRLLTKLLDLMHRDRTGEVINRRLMWDLNHMLMISLGPSVYGEEFEKPFLEGSADFYRNESQKIVECCDWGVYSKIVEELVKKERERVSYYLFYGTANKIASVIEKEMSANFVQILFAQEGSTLTNMLLDDKCDELERLYKLLSRVPNGLLSILDATTSHLKDISEQLVTEVEKVKDPVEVVQRVLDEKAKYDKIINSAFMGDKTFQNALNSSFKYVINSNPHHPEYISLFVAYNLRKGLNQDVEPILDKVMRLFRYLQDKDVFETYYRQHLAERLLSGKAVSSDAETSFILKLRKECGARFTSNLEGMLKDMETSQDTMKGFYSSEGDRTGDGPALNVQVLTTCFWPSQHCPPCKLPYELDAPCENFKSYYLKTRTKGRKLSWQTNMGTADITATFEENRKHELNVSTYQMCVLVLFNNADQLSYKEIEQATELPAPELKKCLYSLACLKGQNVLQKEPMSSDIGESDVFTFNEKFTCKFYKVKISTVYAQKESELESQETRQKVKEDRKPEIDAAIVRIMKSRRVLDQNNIREEVTKLLQSRFLPNKVEIKKQIESLIDRDYIERDSTDWKLYRYIV